MSEEEKPKLKREYDEALVLDMYVWDHYSWELGTEAEIDAARVVRHGKKAKENLHVMIQEQHFRIRKLITPVVITLLKDGSEKFFRTFRERIMREHQEEVFINRCGRCNCIVATPKAKQCLWCGYDWH